MKIGIGLPATIPGTSGKLILDWTRAAEQGPFSSFGIIDRLVYPNYEPLITLAAAAGITSRIRLMTTVLLAPIHKTSILAKQAASLDALSNGRLTLGLGVGAREDDFLAASAAFHDRGKRFDNQLEQMRHIWSGQPLSEQVGAIGPAPVQHGGPEVLLGGYSQAAFRRLARWGDGFLSGGVAPEMAAQLFRSVEDVWQKAGRPGKPRLVACIYYSLGPQAAEQIENYIVNYYGQAGAQMAKSFPSSPEAIRSAVQGFSNSGADELILWPCIPHLDQIKRLSDIVG
ncbi:LLM class flavin-dependent oxidoreductase [Ktedonosporobacter rubrisoli]|uniref:LLM class flavin-dependent oxidoreductase n=1 Tax=Ktedonosporobacter rubrisoli TaxID=2509675 RepID=A0A4P6K5C3_KTERU|nr:LLM class flavin-dependent oxidoreductase [Ktedonosporobacter rubrisoli]